MKNTKKLILTFIIPIAFHCLPFDALSQEDGKKSGFFVELNYGVAANFFVNSYDESGNPEVTSFYSKNWLGTVAGVSVGYAVRDKGFWTFAFSREVHTGKKSFKGNFQGIALNIQDFRLRHFNNFFSLIHTNRFTRNSPFTWSLGLTYLRPEQQEIDFGTYFGPFLGIEERNTQNSALNEGGVVFGLGFDKHYAKKVYFGADVRGYYLATLGMFEAITVTPKIRYQF